MNSKKNLIIAQGGGFRQIECMTGILMALDEMGFSIGEYRGASAGGIMSGIHASGHSGADIAEIIRDTKESDLMSLSWWQLVKFCVPGVAVRYLYNRDGMKRFLEDLIDEDATRLKVLVSLTNAETGESFMLPGTVDSFMGTSAIPEVFEPYDVSGIICVDGGVKNNIPMIDMTDIDDYAHIFILLCNQSPGDKSGAWTKTGRALASLNMTMEREANQVFEEGWHKLPNCTVIQPPPFESGVLSWSKGHSLINHAYQYALELLKTKFK